MTPVTSSLNLNSDYVGGIDASPSHIPTSVILQRYPRRFGITICTIVDQINVWTNQLNYQLSDNRPADQSLIRCLPWFTAYIAAAYDRYERSSPCHHIELDGENTSIGQINYMQNENDNSDPYYNLVGWRSQDELLSEFSPLPPVFHEMYRTMSHAPILVYQCDNPHVPFVSDAFARLLLYDVQQSTETRLV
jgi:hypothetical protein